MRYQASRRDWRDASGYELRLSRRHTRPIFGTDTWAELETAARLCLDPHVQHRRTIVLYGAPRPKSVREFAGLVREIYNSPTKIWLRKTDAVVTFYMDTDDTYLGVKVAASLCKLKWRHR